LEFRRFQCTAQIAISLILPPKRLLLSLSQNTMWCRRPAPH
jgi:hypothetical protein